MPQANSEARNQVPVVLRNSQPQPQASCGPAEVVMQQQLGAS